ncbi:MULTISPECIES: phage terminase small subunit P27 family [Staphylococcus]|uniref:Phage terminase small subunit P27 family n=1 Tax=Staphylococcus equorum TaxID=246432 RepID=A0A9X4R108_9STAP|nr:MULTISPECIES: phage terminase small subunit P27 family [Staphylococcus]KRG09879.1 terminase [Staphylococcus sp. NAM3COL9]MDG0843379.1 phage terminase small subunit P27 family [Staphylococcus equorum]MDG0858690.1 phage terminase small subunit P27 family [Staphylococcus equorum]
MGRNLKLLSENKGNLTVEQQESKKEAEKSIRDLEPLENKPPDWLDGTAKIEYNRIIPLLQELPIASLDLALVSAYCQAYSDYQRATVELASGEMVTFTERGSKVNPWHRVKVDSFNIINSIAPKLGLTIDSRLKIFTPTETKKEDADPMARFAK